MLNVAHYWRNENQNHSEISPHTGQNGHYHKVYKKNAGEGVERREQSCTVGGDVN